jgi:hypothetical protein
MNRVVRHARYCIVMRKPNVSLIFAVLEPKSNFLQFFTLLRRILVASLRLRPLCGKLLCSIAGGNGCPRTPS